MTGTPLTAIEEQELDDYELIDDYLSFVNRMIRNNFIQEKLEITEPVSSGAKIIN